LELPVPVVEGANLPSLEPAGDAVEMEGMIANTPRNSAFLTGGGGLVGLTLDAEIHDVVPTDSTVINNYVPSPERHSVPLLHFEPLLSIRPAFGSSFCLANGLSGRRRSGS